MIRVETFKSKDIQELVVIWNRNLTEDPISPGRLEARVLLDPNFREEFCLVAWEHGNIIGFILGICGEGFRFPGEPGGNRAWILATTVDSKHRKKGVGTALLEESEHRFQEAGKKSIWISSYPTAYIVPGVDENLYAEGLMFLQSKGYKISYSAYAMNASIWSPGTPEIVYQKEKELAQDGFTFHTYSHEWLSAFRSFLRTQLPWDWEWLALRNLSRISEGTFFPHQLHLAAFKDEVVGYCQYEGEHFGPFGVANGFQRKGIGTVLLAHTLDSMAQHGLHNAWILWTGEDIARLYARFGFSKSRKFAILHKEV